jgi:hypothetical protein
MTSAFERSRIASAGCPKAIAAPAHALSRVGRFHWCHRASGRSISRARSCAPRVGDPTVSVRIRNPAPFFSRAFSTALCIADRNAGQERISPRYVRLRERSGS